MEEDKINNEMRSPTMKRNEIGFDEVAHAFFKKLLAVRWRQLAYGVYYYYAENGLYIVTIGFDTYTFYKAHSLEELKKKYY